VLDAYPPTYGVSKHQTRRQYGHASFMQVLVQRRPKLKLAPRWSCWTRTCKL